MTAVRVGVDGEERNEGGGHLRGAQQVASGGEAVAHRRRAQPRS